MHALLLGGSDIVAQNLVELRVELPHISLASARHSSSSSPASFSGTAVGSRAFSGLHLVLMMTLPPKLPAMRVVASRVLVQLAAKRRNISAFHSPVDVPRRQLEIVQTIYSPTITTHVSQNMYSSSGPGSGSGDGGGGGGGAAAAAAAAAGDANHRQPTALELLCLASEDKDAEITANAVISMLHLSVDPRTLRDLMALRVLPKVLSLVSAASANEAMQFRAMLALVSIASMCAKMSDDDFRASQIASGGGRNGIQDVILPILVIMCSAGRDLAVRREAARAMGIFALRGENATSLVADGGFEELLGLAAEAAYGCELWKKARRADQLKSFGASGGAAAASVELTPEEKDDLSVLPSVHMVASCEHVAVQSAGVLVMYASVLEDLETRTNAVKKDGTVRSGANAGPWSTFSKHAQSFHASSVSEFFGNRLGEAYDIEAALLRKNAAMLEPENQRGLIRNRALEFAAGLRSRARQEHLDKLAGDDVHTYSGNDGNNSNGDDDDDERETLLLTEVINDASLAAEANSGTHDPGYNDASSGTPGRSGVPQKVQLHALLALGVLMPADHIAIFKPHWLDIFASLLREPHDGMLRVKAAAAVANIANSAASHLRFVSKAHEYSKRRETWLDDLVPPVRATTMMLGGMTEEEALLALRNENTLHGLDIVSDLVLLLSKADENVGTQREAARAICKLSSNPNGMLVWMRLVGSKRDRVGQSAESSNSSGGGSGNRLGGAAGGSQAAGSGGDRPSKQDSPQVFSDLACECITVIRGNPQLWFQNTVLKSRRTKSPQNLKHRRMQSSKRNSMMSLDSTAMSMRGANVLDMQGNVELSKKEVGGEKVASSFSPSPSSPSSDGGPVMAFGVKFRKMDAILLIPRKRAQDIIGTSLASIDSLEPSAVVSPPGVPLRDGIETPGQAEWTISTWFYIGDEERGGGGGDGGGGGGNAEMATFHTGRSKKRSVQIEKPTHRNASLSSLCGAAGERYGNFATLCEGTNGDQHVCVRVCQDTSEPSEREKELEQIRREKWEDMQEEKQRRHALQHNMGQRQAGRGVDETYTPRARSRHEIGCWDSSKRMWKTSGFDISKLPPGWHHLVTIGTAGRTFFYIALR